MIRDDPAVDVLRDLGAGGSRVAVADHGHADRQPAGAAVDTPFLFHLVLLGLGGWFRMMTQVREMIFHRDLSPSERESATSSARGCRRVVSTGPLSAAILRAFAWDTRDAGNSCPFLLVSRRAERPHSPHDCGRSSWQDSGIW